MARTGPTPVRPRGPLQGAVHTPPAPGSRYLRVLLPGDADPVPAFLPTSLAAALPALAAGDRVLLDMVGRLPVVRADAP